MRPSSRKRNGKGSSFDVNIAMVNAIDYIYQECMEGRYQIDEATFRDKVVEVIGEIATISMESKLHSMCQIVKHRLSVPEYNY